MMFMLEEREGPPPLYEEANNFLMDNFCDLSEMEFSEDYSETDCDIKLELMGYVRRYDMMRTRYLYNQAIEQYLNGGNEV